MAPARIKLDSQTVEAIARRVIELLHAKAAPNPELVDAAELARRLGVERAWVYAHAIEFGAVKLGEGSRPRLRFDPKIAPERFQAGVRAEGAQKRSPSQRMRRPRASGAGDQPPLLPIKRAGTS